jgi:hypothetical protein
MDYIPTARPGSRAPHAWLRDGRSTLDLLGRNFTLLHLGDDGAAAAPMIAAAERRAMPLDVAHVDEADVAELYRSRLVLVRPDGHVAWRGDDIDNDPLAIVDAFRGSASKSSLR